MCWALQNSQTGLVMLVAMVFLMVVAGMSAAVMRSALNADLMSSHARAQAAAEQAAVLALRYCEAVLEGRVEAGWEPHMLPTPHPPGQAWGQAANWTQASPGFRRVPAAWTSANGTPAATTPTPECLMEPALADKVGTYLVTARGYSPGFTKSRQGKTASGAVVWMQSTVRLATTA
jgi:hypothetical protein